MKKPTPFFIAITSFFFLGTFAQEKKQNQLIIPNESINLAESVIVSYRVEERINMPFGAQTTVYTVSNLSLINTVDLGPNNRRTITPKYAKRKKGPQLPPVETAVASNLASPNETISPEGPKSVNINLLDTYERVLNKGYRSAKMLKSVGNGRFFDGDLPMAAKWYSELFEMNTDLEAIYYYRYAQSLASINQVEKASEMMKIFETKNL